MSISQWWKSVWGKIVFWSVFFSGVRFGHDLWVGAQNDSARMMAVFYMVLMVIVICVIKTRIDDYIKGEENDKNNK